MAEFKYFYDDPKNLNYDYVDIHGREMIKYINEHIPWMKTTMYCSGHPVDGDERDFDSGWFGLAFSSQDKIAKKIQSFNNHIDSVANNFPDLKEDGLLFTCMQCYNKQLSDLLNIIYTEVGKTNFHLDLVIFDMDKYLEFINTFRKDSRIKDIVVRHEETRLEFGTPYKYEEWDIAEIFIWYQSRFERESIINAMFDNLIKCK